MAHITVDVNGTAHDIDLDFGKLTLKESVLVQRMVGNQAWDEFTTGVMRPNVLEAIVFAKLRGSFPDLSVDDFDFDLADAFAREEAEEGNS